jgi:hypothetical protein
MARELLMAIDPGNAKSAGRVCYAAQFLDGELDLLRLFDRHSARDWVEHAGAGPDVVVIEKPQMDGRSRKVPPRVLIDLSWNGALVAGALNPDNLVALTPSAWKGSVSKAPHHLRIWRTLNQHERLVVAASEGLTRKKPQLLTTDDVYAVLRGAAEHHVRTGNTTKHAFYDLLDAVGLGLRYLGRIGGGTGKAAA